MCWNYGCVCLLKLGGSFCMGISFIPVFLKNIDFQKLNRLNANALAIHRGFYVIGYLELIKNIYLNYLMFYKIKVFKMIHFMADTVIIQIS